MTGALRCYIVRERDRLTRTTLPKPGDVVVGYCEKCGASFDAVFNSKGNRQSRVCPGRCEPQRVILQNADEMRERRNERDRERLRERRQTPEGRAKRQADNVRYRERRRERERNAEAA